jgi:hypothetical protein
MVTQVETIPTLQEDIHVSIEKTKQAVAFSLQANYTD